MLEVKLWLREQGHISQKLETFRASRTRAGSKGLEPVERVSLIPVVCEPGTLGFG